MKLGHVTGGSSLCIVIFDSYTYKLFNNFDILALLLLLQHIYITSLVTQ